MCFHRLILASRCHPPHLDFQPLCRLRLIEVTGSIWALAAAVVEVAEGGGVAFGAFDAESEQVAEPTNVPAGGLVEDAVFTDALDLHPYLFVDVADLAGAHGGVDVDEQVWVEGRRSNPKETKLMHRLAQLSDEAAGIDPASEQARRVLADLVAVHAETFGKADTRLPQKAADTIRDRQRPASRAVLAVARHHQRLARNTHPDPGIRVVHRSALPSPTP
jgi:hypothetical protein